MVKLRELKLMQIKGELAKRKLFNIGNKADFLIVLESVLKNEGNDPETYEFCLSDISNISHKKNENSINASHETVLITTKDVKSSSTSGSIQSNWQSRQENLLLNENDQDNKDKNIKFLRHNRDYRVYDSDLTRSAEYFNKINAALKLMNARTVINTHAILAMDSCDANNNNNNDNFNDNSN